MVVFIQHFRDQDKKNTCTWNLSLCAWEKKSENCIAAGWSCALNFSRMKGTSGMATDGVTPVV